MSSFLEGEWGKLGDYGKQKFIALFKNHFPYYILSEKE